MFEMAVFELVESTGRKGVTVLPIESLSSIEWLSGSKLYAVNNSMA